MTISALLAFFTLLTTACFSFFAAARFKIPYTVLLVAVGLLLVPVAHIPAFAFLRDFQLTPELLFYIFLPILIFESAYNIRVRNIQQNVATIAALAIPSLLLSTVFITLVLTAVLALTATPMPLMVVLLFAALISATDPVAVLALFKEYGVPRRLSLIFEGESLFNDGTAVALFLVLLEVAYKGYHGANTIGEGLSLFICMVIGGLLFGVFMGAVFSKMLEATRSNTHVSIVLMLVMAHLTFILAEMVSHHTVIAGVEIKISSIIATTVASIILGNYGRYKINPHAEEFVEQFWSQVAFMSNALVFILMGLLFTTLPIEMLSLALPIGLAIIVVAAGRALSIYPIIAILNRLKIEEHIPMSWQHLLAWGSLRGALAITMVLMIPADWQPDGWAYDHAPKDFITALTIGCIYASLFIKALTIGPLIKKMGLNALTSIEKAEYRDASGYIHAHAQHRLDTLKTKGYIDAPSFDIVKERMMALHTTASTRYQISHETLLTHAALNIHALGIERYYLHDLFTHGEINDWIMRRIQAIISSQIEILENGETLADHPRAVKGDWLEQAIDALHSLSASRQKKAFMEKFLYYRAKAIITRKVVKEMTQFSKDNVKLFTPEEVQPVIDRYAAYHKVADTQLRQLLADHGKELQQLNITLATQAIEKYQHQLLDELLERELITPRVHITLRDRVDF